MRHDGQDIRQFPRQRAKEELFYYFFGLTETELPIRKRVF